MTAAIETHNLVKRYGEVTAVDDLSLCVNRGEIYAFLGLNGAGKTTTIRLLLGMVKPTSGEAFVLGRRTRLGERKPWDSVGYLVEVPYAYPELTVLENLETVRRLRNRTEPESVKRVVERLGLSAYANRRAGTLSHGNQQRLGLAKALLHNPELLLLDEPTSGLDPAGIVEIRDMLLQLVREQGITVFMSSHILGEVSRLAQRIGIIHRGRLLQELDIPGLEKERRRKLVIGARDPGAAQSILIGAGFSPEMLTDGTVKLMDIDAIERPEEVATLMVQAGHPPTLLKVEQEDLEHYFLRLIGMNKGNAS